jgi:hypothetical protein
VGYIACRGKMSNAFKILVTNIEGKRLPGTLRYRWEDNIKLDVGEIGWEGVDWVHVAQDRDLIIADKLNFNGMSI